MFLSTGDRDGKAGNEAGTQLTIFIFLDPDAISISRIASDCCANVLLGECLVVVLDLSLIPLLVVSFTLFSFAVITKSLLLEHCLIPSENDTLW